MSTTDAFGKTAEVGQDVAFIDNPWDSGHVLERGKIIQVAMGNVLVSLMEETFNFNILTLKHDIKIIEERTQWVESSGFVIL